MAYIDENLVPGESVIYRAKTHWAVFVWPVILLLLVTYICFKIDSIIGVLALLFSLVVLIRLALAYFTTEFGLTNKRIVAKTGLLQRRSLEMMLSKVESISVSQSLDGRMFGFGSIIVVGSGGTKQAFPMIANPMALRQKVNTQIAAIGEAPGMALAH